MKLILLEKVQNLGDLGQRVKVKAGFGRNYLVPQGKAVAATPVNIERFEVMRAELEKAAKDRLASAGNRAAALHDLVLTIKAIASDEGKLYGSIGPREIADALGELGHTVSKREVIMPEGPLRLVGEFDVQLQLHADVDTVIKVTIVAE
jgi:large subunit ribosomal protein L9